MPPASRQKVEKGVQGLVSGGRSQLSPHWPCATRIGDTQGSKGTDVFRQAHHPVTLLNAPTTTHQLTPTSLWQSAHTAQHERNPVSTLMFKEMSEEKQARFPLKDEKTVKERQSTPGLSIPLPTTQSKGGRELKCQP